MAINFKLSAIKRINPDDDPMDRSWVGYGPELSVAETFQQNRGMWILGSRAATERFATFSFGSRIVVVATVDSVETIAWPEQDGRRDKQAVCGKVLGRGHPAYQHYLGLFVDSHRNPVTYLEDPDDL